MAHLAGSVAAAAVELAADDDPAPAARADGHVQHVVEALGLTAALLRQGPQVPVVVEDHGHEEVGLQAIHDREVPPAHQRRVDYHAPLGVERPGAPDTDPEDLVRRHGELPYDGVEDGLGVLVDGLLALEGLGLRGVRVVVDHRPCLIEQGTGGLRAPDVHCQIITAHIV